MITLYFYSKNNKEDKCITMEDSPLVSPIIKEYCAKFNIENVLNSAINEVMTKLPSDPYSLLCNYLKKVKYNI